MTVIQPLYMNGLLYTGEAERRGLSSAFAVTSAGVQRTGVLGEIEPTCTITNKIVTVAALQCVIGTVKGGYATGLDSATVVGTLVDPDVTNNRVDLVVLEVLDPTNGSPGAEKGGVLRIVTGLAAPIPAAPSTPANSIALFRVTVPRVGAGAPSWATVAAFTAASGAPIPVRNKDERDAIPARENLQVRRLDTNTIDIYTGGAWIEGDTGWIKLGRVQGFLDYTSSGWDGVWFRCLNNVVTISGALTRPTAWPNAQPIVALGPASPYKPKQQIQGVNCIMKTNGDIIVSAGSGPVSLHVSYPL